MDMKIRCITELLVGSLIDLLFIAVIFFSGKAPETKETPIEAVKDGPIKAETAKAEPVKEVVFQSVLADRGWYSANANELENQIETYYRQAKVEPKENVIALILPHAGYRYSGQTAVSGIKTADKKYKRIVIIGPSHILLMEEILSVPRATHYQTPLGQVPLDVEFINELLKYTMFQNVPQAHRYEHSVQIEVPLLQYNREDFKIVPIVAGQCSLKTIEKVGVILKSLIDNETLVIASSDFVHYGPSYGYVPFDKNIPEEIKKIDMGAYEHIANLDGKEFLSYKQKTGALICGSIPIAILLSMFEQNVKAELVRYATSGELMGDFTNSVSYLSVAFSGVWANHPQVEPQSNTSELTEEDKKQLLILARKTMVYAVQNHRVPQESELGVTISDAMRCPRAAFVTLKKNSELRGCIGDVLPRRPLYKSVIMNAINASFNDTRFPQLREEECNDITIEISALTVPEPIASPDEIRIGIDGVVLSKDGYSALYLPQVAPELGWDIAQTLTHLSMKAQLPPDAWKEGASFMVFQAIVFGEEDR
jgi:AmmeMemoRadiSam system protein B/AmmeMemoRadiSam system protein A